MGIDIIAWNTSNIKSTRKYPMGSVLVYMWYTTGGDNLGTVDYWNLIN